MDNEINNQEELKSNQELNLTNVDMETGNQIQEKKEKRFPYLKKFENKLESAKSTLAKDTKIKRMYLRGHSQIAKKMGEEAVEMVIASEQDSDEHFLEEAADVLYYYMMAIHARGFKLRDVLKVLKKR